MPQDDLKDESGDDVIPVSPIDRMGWSGLSRDIRLTDVKLPPDDKRATLPWRGEHCDPDDPRL